jgi:hypothetical protein
MNTHPVTPGDRGSNMTDSEWLEALTKRAVEICDGHLTIMRFTGNWRVGFGTLNSDDYVSHRMAIAQMPAGKTFAEAAAIALERDFLIQRPTEDEVRALKERWLAF